MATQNPNKIKRQRAVLRSLAFLMLPSSLSHASYELREDDQRRIINAHQLPSYIDGRDVKIAIIDGYFDPNSDTRNALSTSTKAAYKEKNLNQVADIAHWIGGNHANHVSSSIHNVVPNAELRVIDLNNDPSVCDKVQDNARVIAAIDKAIESKVDFINISRRIAPDGDWVGQITKEVKAAFLKARDAGIGVIKSAGNDQEFTGGTAYTRSLVKLLEEMRGSMILAAATQYDTDWQYEKLAGFCRGEMNLKTGKMTELPTGSNYAGLAHEYTVSAPGKYNYAYGARNQRLAMSGTSMAAPIVTGAAGLIKSAHPDLSSSEVLSYILQSARTKSLGNKLELPAGKYGRGIVDVGNALQMIKGQK